ncbi:hypothetical protein [Enterococcus rivorum]
MFLTQLLLAIDGPDALTEIQSYMAEETFEKQYTSEKFNYQINHNIHSEDTHAQTIVQITKI